MRVHIIDRWQANAKDTLILFMLKIIRSKTLIFIYFETDFNKQT